MARCPMHVVGIAWLAVGASVLNPPSALGAAPSPQPTPVPAAPPSPQPSPGNLWQFGAPDAPVPEQSPLVEAPPPDATAPPLTKVLAPAPELAESRRVVAFGVQIAPLSGAVALANPRAGDSFTPALATVGAGVSVAVRLSEMFHLELALSVDFGFGSSDLGRLGVIFETNPISFDSLTVTTIGTAPSVVLLMDWAGLGLVYDHRWDSVISSAAGATPETFDNDGGALGLRLLGGLWLRATGLRVVWEFDWYFRDGRGGKPAFLTSLRLDGGAIALIGSYESLYAISGASVPYARRIASVSIGFQSVF